MRKSLAITAVTLLSLAVIACGDKKSGGPKPPPPVPPQCTSNCPPPPCTTPGCLPPATGVTRFFDGIHITNGGQYEKLVRDLMFCDPYSWVNLGAYDCDTWDDKGEIQMTVQNPSKLPSQATVTIIGYSIWGGVLQATRQATFTGTVFPINNNTGWQFQAIGLTGTYTYNKYLDLIAPTGNIATDKQLSVDLLYNATQFGDADLVRY